ncbi:hypothetical protein THOM_0448 [Trachipleistophora hominis]|uniref:Uncharacterized protein n=1 Tax=Trachipleistophora hominis TaxID=72359 RepID=L7JYQ6_TRAHO|nr:hypothetical protein THOM_0448 [Trachipleistophora hominis]
MSESLELCHFGAPRRTKAKIESDYGRMGLKKWKGISIYQKI